MTELPSYLSTKFSTQVLNLVDLVHAMCTMVPWTIAWHGMAWSQVQVNRNVPGTKFVYIFSMKFSSRCAEKIRWVWVRTGTPMIFRIRY